MALRDGRRLCHEGPGPGIPRGMEDQPAGRQAMGGNAAAVREAAGGERKEARYSVSSLLPSSQPLGRASQWLNSAGSLRLQMLGTLPAGQAGMLGRVRKVQGWF